MQKCLPAILSFLLLSAISLAQDCIGGQIFTHEAYLYGRFEVRMQSVDAGGVVSSFFLYNLDTNCNWDEELNEIDIEMTGLSPDLLFTTHYPGPWMQSDTYSADFNPHEGLNEYAIEWEPGIVRWFANGALVNVQNQDFVAGLIHPMRLMMNLWVSPFPGWVGDWDPAVMPVESVYDWVRYYEYTPGEGNTGTANNFTLTWEDEFDQLDEDRWMVSPDAGFGNNLCRFRESSVVFENGFLYLQLEDPATLPSVTVPVTFSVNTSDQDLSPTDVIHLAGGFNDWCGNCMPMTEQDGVWSITVDLEPGNHEYLFSKNFWEENGGAPQGSSCDFIPCDEWLNYGVTVSAYDDPIILDTPCWGTCESCTVTSTTTPSSTKTKKLLKICDINGREVQPTPGQVLLYLYDDGTVERRIFIAE